MKLIPLTQGHSAIVDDGDYEFLTRWKWHVLVGKDHVYAMRNSRPVSGKRHHILMHRVLCGTPKGKQTDHKNGDSLDNRRSNLRVATRIQNMRNRSKRAKATSKFKGVHWHKQHRKWCATIKGRFIGLFTVERDAALAYEARAKKAFGEFHRSQII